MRADFSRAVTLVRSSRTTQVEGIFGIEPAERVERHWSVDLPLEAQEWAIGLIVGPSGSGKTSLLEDVFATDIEPEWPSSSAVIDGFPDEMETTEIAGLLSAVGFSSPPAWLRPWWSLSTGEQFRADLAWRLAVAPAGEVTVVDEFTSTVDRTVAKTSSVAVSRLVRRQGRHLVAASCHYDIVDWLQPDWVFDTALGSFTWRSLQPRPPIALDIRRGDRSEWAAFAPHHYLSGNLSLGAEVYVGEVDGRLATLAAVVSSPSPRGYAVRREHRLVCLPDHQGVGLGHAMADLVASCYRRQGWRFRSVTSHPAVVGHRARSPLWLMSRQPSHEHIGRRRGSSGPLGTSAGRLTAAFEFVGPAALAQQATDLGVPRFRRADPGAT